MGVVIFNESAFLVLYPQFADYAAANPGALQARFNQVTALYIKNTSTAYVQDVTIREQLIWLAMAHVLQLAGVNSINGQGSTAGTVGRVSSATEGSVSASLVMGNQPASAAWWNQTQYGAEFWTATAPWRTFRYARSPSRCRHGR